MVVRSYCVFICYVICSKTALSEELFQHNREGVNFKNTAIYKFEGMPLK